MNSFKVCLTHLSLRCVFRAVFRAAQRLISLLRTAAAPGARALSILSATKFRLLPVHPLASSYNTTLSNNVFYVVH